MIPLIFIRSLDRYPAEVQEKNVSRCHLEQLTRGAGSDWKEQAAACGGMIAQPWCGKQAVNRIAGQDIGDVAGCQDNDPV
jgi:hypothetical protein